MLTYFLSEDLIVLLQYDTMQYSSMRKCITRQTSIHLSRTTVITFIDLRRYQEERIQKWAKLLNVYVKILLIKLNIVFVLTK